VHYCGEYDWSVANEYVVVDVKVLKDLVSRASGKKRKTLIFLPLRLAFFTVLEFKKIFIFSPFSFMIR